MSQQNARNYYLEDCAAFSNTRVRLAISIDGTETLDDLKRLPELDPVMLLNDPDASLSHLHSSRRLFEVLKSEGMSYPVIHVFSSATIDDKNELALQIGMRLGSLLTDGLGDGVCLDVKATPAKRFSVNELRELSFGLLQGCR